MYGETSFVLGMQGHLYNILAEEEVRPGGRYQRNTDMFQPLGSKFPDTTRLLFDVYLVI